MCASKTQVQQPPVAGRRNMTFDQASPFGDTVGAPNLFVFFWHVFSFSVGGCSPSFFHIFIGSATVFIDFLAFVLFPLGFPWFSNFPGFFQWSVHFSKLFDCFSLVFVTCPCFSMLLLAFWFM